MPVKKTAAKKPAAKKSASDGSSAVDQIINAIKDGALDGFLADFDQAVTNRLTAVEKENSKTPAAKPAATPKKVSPPPKRRAAAAKVTLTAGKTYQVDPAMKGLGGAKVKFTKLKDSDKTKAVVEMVTGKPGNPKGKRVLMPADALVEVPAAAKKTPAKKSASSKK